MMSAQRLVCLRHDAGILLESRRGLAQAVQSLFEDRSDPIRRIAEGAFS